MFKNFFANLLVGLKVLLVLAIPGGLIMAGIGWHERARVADLLARGVEAQARIDGGTRTTGRRSGTSHALNLSWTGPNGAPLRAEGVRISGALAGQVISGERITQARTAIKYLPEDPANPVILDDAANQLSSNGNLVAIGLVAFVVGSLATVFMVWRLRRRRAMANAAPA